MTPAPVGLARVRLAAVARLALRLTCRIPFRGYLMNMAQGGAHVLSRAQHVRFPRWMIFLRRWLVTPNRIVVPLILLALPAGGSLEAQESPAKTEGPAYIARDVEPAIKKMQDLKRIMRRVYPSGYRDTGLDVTSIMWVYVEPDGTVGGHQVLKSSGYEVFDRAAEQVVEGMVFTPALRNGEPVGVWVNQAVHFKSGESGRFLEGPALLAEEPQEVQNSEEDAESPPE